MSQKLTVQFILYIHVHDKFIDYRTVNSVFLISLTLPKQDFQEVLEQPEIIPIRTNVFNIKLEG